MSHTTPDTGVEEQLKKAAEISSQISKLQQELCNTMPPKTYFVFHRHDRYDEDGYRLHACYTLKEAEEFKEFLLGEQDPRHFSIFITKKVEETP